MSLLDEALALPAKVLLVKDCVATSGAFILHHLIKKRLTAFKDMLDNPTLKAHSSNPIILFVGLKEPFTHYERILRKIGCNLSTYRQDGQFIFLDMMHLDCRESDNSLFEVYKCIYESVQKPISSRTENICIMIDDASLLEVATYGRQDDVLDFLHYCHVITSDQGCSLVLLAHQDIYEGLDNTNLIQHLEHLADVIVNIEPLSSGLSADIHGQFAAAASLVRPVSSPSQWPHVPTAFFVPSDAVCVPNPVSGLSTFQRFHVPDFCER